MSKVVPFCSFYFSQANRCALNRLRSGCRSQARFSSSSSSAEQLSPCEPTTSWEIPELSRLTAEKKLYPSSRPHILDIYHDVITPEEEAVLMKYFNPILSRRHYEGSHWDGVISKYKEIELTKSYRLTPAVQTIFNRVMQRIRYQMQEKDEAQNGFKFIYPHVIDLAGNGWIGPHVDSIKFSGSFVCGLSLLSDRIMQLTKDYQVTPETATYCLEISDAHPDILAEFKASSLFPQTIDMFLPRRSLYIMRGIWRYHYAHAVLPATAEARAALKAGIKPEESQSRGEVDGMEMEQYRRISVIFRDELVLKEPNK